MCGSAFPLFLSLLLCFLASFPVHAAPSPNYENRVALVIGVSDYRSPERFDLPNAVADVNGVSRQLGELGFKVAKYLNPGSVQIPEIIRKFRESLSPGSVALFYFSGHGFQSEGRNYLLLDPLPSSGLTMSDVKRSSLALDDVIAVFEKSKTQINLALLDACRIPPVKGIVTTGLAEVVAPGNTVVGFATHPGGVALQFDDDRYSLYTKYLLPNMAAAGLTIEQVLKAVGKNVFNATKNEKRPQQPWMQSSLYEDFFLVQDIPIKTKGNEKGDIEQWFRIKESGDQQDFQKYLQQFPNGLYTLHAKQKIHALNEQAAQGASASRDAAVAEISWQKSREILSGRGFFEELDAIVASSPNPVAKLKSAAQENETALALWCALLTHERYRVPGKLVNEWPLCEQRKLTTTSIGQFIVGRAMYFGRGATKNHAAATALLRKSAAAGNPLAANFLGDIQFNAQYPDCAAMKRNYLLAANGGNANAFNNIGVAYLKGRCFIADPYEARQWFRKASAMGNPWAQTNLGVMLLTGLGGGADAVEGFALIELAARKGHAQAWVLLGRYYEMAREPGSLELARQWYLRTLQDSSEEDLLAAATTGLARLGGAH